MKIFNLTRFAFRSAGYYWKNHLGTFLGTLVGTGVLAGALFVGDSVKGSLRQQALFRVGTIDKVITAGDRFFRDSLSEEMSTVVSGTRMTAALMTRGVAVSSKMDARANQVQILGVTPDFWEFDPFFEPNSESSRSGVWLNRALADQLGIGGGDEILLRLEKPSILTRESALTPQEDFAVAWRTTVAGVLPRQSLGAFSLYTGQSAPRTAFVPLNQLQDELELGAKANMVLVEFKTESGDETESAAGDLLKSMEEIWTLDDASLSVNDRSPVDSLKVVELSSPRVFLEDPVEKAAEATGLPSHKFLTYFVNSIDSADGSTPYSMVSGTSDPDLIGDCPPGGIVLNDWLAEDLNAGPDDEITLEYYLMGEANRLETASRRFTVHAVIPMEGKAADRTLMPDFPGVAEAETTRDWDAGFPLDLDRILDKDEKYWQDFRGTPKAFLRLDDARSMWANRFGDITAVRFESESSDSNGGLPPAGEVGLRILGSLAPEAIGFTSVDLRGDAMRSASQSFDFGQLFISFSFFLILSALILVMLFFQFGVERRLHEIGILTAIGYTVPRVRRILFTEGLIIATAGSIAGVLAGRLYAQLMVYGLTTAWKDAVAETRIEFFASSSTAIIGLVCGILVALGAMAMAFWKYSRLSPSRLLVSSTAALPDMDQDKPADGKKRKRSGRFPWLATACLIGAAGLFVPALKAQGPSAAGMFFGSGALALASIHLFFNMWLTVLRTASDPRISRWQLAIRNMARRPGRSLAVVASLACGGFLVTAISPFRMDASADASSRDSGTGGYALYGRSAVPVVHDLNSQEGRDFFGFDPDELENLEWVPMRLREGDDASCLNLNMAQQPKVLGVDPSRLSAVGAFSFSGSPWDGLNAGNLSGWELLNATLEDGSIPAIIDAATLQWALRKTTGDTLEYPGPDGSPVTIRFVATLQGSMLQGSVLLSDKNFRKAFPGISGFREFLINAPDADEMSRLLTRVMEDFGMEITPSAQVLNRFNAVQNTYISTFQLLGQLGVILGSLGIAVIALRNVLERAGEFGVLEAIGFRRGTLRWQVGLEHWLLLATGLLFGLVSACIAVLPPVLSGVQSLSITAVISSLAWIFVTGSVWVLVAVFVAFRGHFRDSLREL